MSRRACRREIFMAGEKIRRSGCFLTGILSARLSGLKRALVKVPEVKTGKEALKNL